MGKTKIVRTKSLALFLIVLSGAVLLSVACSRLPEGKKVEAPPPEGLFPQQMGKFVLSSEAKQSESSVPDAKYKTYYAYYKYAEGNSVECTVTVYDDQLPPSPASKSSPSTRVEEVFKSDSIYIGHDVAIERMVAAVRGERINYSARTDSVPAIKDFVESLPYDVLKAAPPPKPLNLVVTPPEFDKGSKDKADTEFEKSGREALMSAIAIWCKSKNVTCSPRPSKTDKSTLLLEARGKTGADVDKQRDAMVKEVKQKSGEALKAFGFRQVAVSLAIEKL